METRRRSYNSSTMPTGATRGAGNVFYVSHPYPSQSAFSCSDTTSLMSDSSFDKSFLKRMIYRGKARFSTRNPKSPTSSPEKTDTVFEMTPSPHTHPLLCKPSARDELRAGRKRISRASSHGDLLGATTRQRVRGLGVYGAGLADDREEVENLASPEMYKRNLRNRERVAMAAAQDGRHVAEWGFFIKCYSEGRFNLSNPPEPPPKNPGFNHFSAPVPPSEGQRLKVCYNEDAGGDVRFC